MNNYTLYILSQNTNEFELIDIEYGDMLTVYNIEQIEDITKRIDNITKDITLKGTERNNIAFGHLYDISRYSSDTYATQLQHNFKANQFVKCILLENNIQILKGDLLIRSIDINENNIIYNCCIVGSFMSFFNDIGNRSLDELDSLNDEIRYSIGEVLDSWFSSSVNNLNYVFPSIDYGVDERSGDNINWYDNKFDIKNFRPAIKVKSYIDAIFKGFRYDLINERYTQFNTDNTSLSKYSFQSSLLNNNEFKRLIIPHNEEIFTKKITGTWNTITFGASSFNASLGRVRVMSVATFTGFNNTFFNVENITLKPEENNPSMSISNVNSLISRDSNIKTRLKISTTLTLKSDMQGTFHIGLANIKDKEYIDLDNLALYQTVVKTSTTEDSYSILIEKTDDFAFDGKYVFVILKEGNQGINYSTTNIKIELGSPNVPTQLPVAFDTYFKLYEAIPKGVKIIDFMKSIMTMFNLYMVENPDKENEYIIEPYNEFYKDIINFNINKAVDWTNKIDFEKYSLKTNINLPKSYSYKFTEDSDMLNEFYKKRYGKIYGDFNIIDSKAYGESKETTLTFSPTINISHSMNSKKLPVLYKASGFLTGKKEPMQTKLRIMYFNGQKSTNNYWLHYTGIDIQSISNYGYTSMFRVNNTNQITDSLLFDLPLEYFTQDDITQNRDITLFNKYHQQQLKDITDENIIIFEGEAFLNEIDIQKLNFRHPIYIQTKYGSSYFKLLSVEYTNNYTPSTVRLQKIVL